MAERDDEDEGLRKFKEKIEQKCLSKRATKRRKVYLGPDSIDAIPRRSKYRLQKTDESLSHATTTESSCEMETSVSTQGTQGIQIPVENLSMNTGPIDLSCHQVTFDCAQFELPACSDHHVLPPDLIVDNSTSTISRQSMPTNDDETTSQSSCNQIVCATHHSTQKNQVPKFWQVWIDEGDKDP